jgi:endonuclease/exonuclease/phosphatase (EEP) superfamily protein YafD
MPSGLESAAVILCWVYIGGLVAWTVSWFSLADRFRILFFLNSLGHLFFLPAPAVLAVAAAAGNSGLAVAGVFVTLACLYLWTPPLASLVSRRHTIAAGPMLRAATYNLLWVNKDEAAVIAAIRALDADVIALQEISPAHAAAIESHLGAEYPCQVLQPGFEAYGNGLISRLPFTPSPDILPDPDWIGDPIIATLTVDGRDVTAVCCHTAPVRTPAAARERQARALVDYARRLDEPCIVLGDFNSTPLNEAYRILCRDLRDVWRDAGRGLGHTFPGPAYSNARGDGLPRPLRRFIPHWLLRIDHIFVTEHWRAVSARVSPQHGGSDHRPVVADLCLRG